MTIAAAAICTEELTLGGRKHAVLCISDRMLTADDVEFEQGNHTKIGRLEPARAVCLFAGDVAANVSVLTASQREVQKGGTKNVSDIAAALARNLTSFKNAKAERKHLSSFGLDMESFISRQAELSSEFVADMSHRISSEILNVDMIVAGVDERGATVYSLYSPNAFGDEAFHETCHEGSGFWAIGSGSRQFLATLMASGYDTTWRLQDALLLMYSAKKRAETSPGVGRLTDIYVISEGMYGLLSLPAMEVLESHYARFENEVKRVRSEAVNKMVADEKLLTIERT